MHFFPSSKLFFACDVIIFPYLFVPNQVFHFHEPFAHVLPFIASDFFMKFARMDRGITYSRNVESFSEATDLKSNYENIKKMIQSNI
jgi:hypothetical protein